MKRTLLILVTAAAIALSGLLSSTAQAWGPGYGNDRRPTGYVAGYYGGYGAFGGYGTNVAFYAPNVAYLAPNVALYNSYSGGYGGVIAPGCNCNYAPYGVGYGGYGGYAPYQRYHGGCNWGY